MEEMVPDTFFFPLYLGLQPLFGYLEWSEPLRTGSSNNYSPLDPTLIYL